MRVRNLELTSADPLKIVSGYLGDGLRIHGREAVAVECDAGTDPEVRTGDA
jgi:hypothetical protein